jgi:adenine phosphoribosyltransferase
VEKKKNVLIVTDGTNATQKMASGIVKALKGARIVSIEAADFGGQDILPAEVYFFGCEKAEPISFAYFSRVLRHINLVGRPCGVFSPQSKEAIAYLADLVHDSEVALYAKPLFEKDIEYVKSWTEQVISKGQSFNLDDYIGKVPDFPKKGILFYDITTILTSPAAFDHCLDNMVELYEDKNIEAIAAIEARGFLFAAPFADRMGIPLILIRKKGKLPGKKISAGYKLEYGEAEIEVHVDDIPAGKRVLLMDDLIATGGTLKAAYGLLTGAGAVIPEIFGIVGLPFMNYQKNLPGVPVRTLIQYHSE